MSPRARPSMRQRSAEYSHDRAYRDAAEAPVRKERGRVRQHVFSGQADPRAGAGAVRELYFSHHDPREHQEVRYPRADECPQPVESKQRRARDGEPTVKADRGGASRERADRHRERHFAGR